MNSDFVDREGDDQGRGPDPDQWIEASDARADRIHHRIGDLVEEITHHGTGIAEDGITTDILQGIGEMTVKVADMIGIGIRTITSREETGMEGEMRGMMTAGKEEGVMRDAAIVRRRG